MNLTDIVLERGALFSLVANNSLPCYVVHRCHSNHSCISGEYVGSITLAAMDSHVNKVVCKINWHICYVKQCAGSSVGKIQCCEKYLPLHKDKYDTKCCF